MKGRNLRRRFSLQPSFMSDGNNDDKHKRDKFNPTEAVIDSSCSKTNNIRYKIVVLGAAKVGKTSIITQFLYNKFAPKYKRTVEEMFQGNYSIAGVNLTLDILDTSGAYEFPAMRTLSIQSADGFILVYDVTNSSSFDEIRVLREQIHEVKGGTTTPIVVVGNKIDLVESGCLAKEVEYSTVESFVKVDWNNGLIECSAKNNDNVVQIFKELLSQAKIACNLSPALPRKRRQSLPLNQGTDKNECQTPDSTPSMSSHMLTTAHLHHLEKIQQQALSGKNKSCVIS